MEKEKYVKSVLEYEDVQEALECVRENSLQEGVERGKEEGREEGRAEERTEWLAERRKIILNMLSRGFDIHTVADVANMTEEEIRKIAE